MNGHSISKEVHTVRIAVAVLTQREEVFFQLAYVYSENSMSTSHYTRVYTLTWSSRLLTFVVTLNKIIVHPVSIHVSYLKIPSSWHELRVFILLLTLKATTFLELNRSLHATSPLFLDSCIIARGTHGGVAYFISLCPFLSIILYRFFIVLKGR